MLWNLTKLSRKQRDEDVAGEGWSIKTLFKLIDGTFTAFKKEQVLQLKVYI